MSIAVVSCRLGVAKYLLPFFFIIDPSLLMQGEILDVIQAFFTTAVGLILVGSALEGYLIGLGNLRQGGLAWIFRVLLIAGGIMLSLPGWRYDMGGLAVSIVGVGLLMMASRLQVRENAV